MAGGLLVLLGMNSRLEGPLVGGYLGTGMHGGEIYLRGEVEPWQCGKEVGVFTATEEDMAELEPVLAEYCEALGMDLDEVLSVPFTKPRAGQPPAVREAVHVPVRTARPSNRSPARPQRAAPSCVPGVRSKPCGNPKQTRNTTARTVLLTHVRKLE